LHSYNNESIITTERQIKYMYVFQVVTNLLLYTLQIISSTKVGYFVVVLYIFVCIFSFFH